MDAKELVDLIFPEHSRISCSDEKIENGICEYDKIARCSRCALLSLIEDPEKIKLVDLDSTYIFVRIKQKTK